MKIKKWIWGIGIVLALALMVGLDGYKVHKEEKPPFPHVTVGNTEVNVTLGEFKWNSELMNDKEQIEILADAKSTNVNPLEDLTIDFPNEKPTYAKVFVIGDPWYDENYPVFEGEIHKNEQIQIPNRTGNLVIKINANFEGTKKSTYYVSLERDLVVSYQDLLSEYSNEYSLYFVASSTEQQAMMFDPILNGALPIYNWNGTDNLEMAQKQYPDLNINKSPSYYILDNKEVVLQANNMDEIISFFESIYEPSQMDFYGPIMEIDQESQIIAVSGQKFYVENIDNLKIGQEVHAVVTFNHLIDPLQTDVHTLKVEIEPPEELLDEQWRPTSPDKYSVLGIGDGAFLEPLSNPTFTEQFPDVEVNFHNGDLYPLGYTFVIFNHEEAVFATYNYDELVKYLAEHPLK